MRYTSLQMSNYQTPYIVVFQAYLLTVYVNWCSSRYGFPCLQHSTIISSCFFSYCYIVVLSSWIILHFSSFQKLVLKKINSIHNLLLYPMKSIEETVFIQCPLHNALSMHTAQVCEVDSIPVNTFLQSVLSRNCRPSHCCTSRFSNILCLNFSFCH